MKLTIGSKAPNFTLLDQEGNKHSLSNYKGKRVLLYFYPKDNTSGCIKEACMIRDDFLGFKKLNVTIIGVSVDSVKSHKKFAEEYNLPFTLLSDEQKEVVNLYGVWAEKSMSRLYSNAGSSYAHGKVGASGYGKKYMGTLRTSFLINPKGRIEKVYEKVNPSDHSREVLEDLKSFVK